MDTRSPENLASAAAEVLLRATVCTASTAAWDVSIRGSDRLPPGPCFIYGNHSNNFDPFILNRFTEWGQPSAGVMTMEFAGKGFIGSLFRATGIEATRKSVPEPHLIRRIYRLLEKGRRIVIFPEGGRRWDGRPAPWIASTAKLFWRMGVPVHPVRIHGSYVSWPRWARWPRPARITVEPLPAVDFAGCHSLEAALTRLKRPVSAFEDVFDNASWPHSRPPWSFRPADGFNKLAYRCPKTGAFNALRSPDGRHVLDGTGRVCWQMQPDSTLVSPDGTRHASGDVYARIKSMGDLSTGSRPIIRHMAEIRITAFDDLANEPLQRLQVALYPDRVEMGALTLPVDEIRYMGLERSDRIWLAGRGKQVYCRFPDTCSTLAWYDTLLRINPHINT